MINPTNNNIMMFNLQSKNIDNLSANSKSSSLKEEELKKAASDFESVFVRQFLDLMDTTVTKSEFMRGGQGEEIFKSMLNDQIAQNIASDPSTSFGLAKQVYEQMKSRL
jgi:peptidoglycan hydrolase FlgJ